MGAEIIGQIVKIENGGKLHLLDFSPREIAPGVVSVAPEVRNKKGGITVRNIRDRVSELVVKCVLFEGKVFLAEDSQRVVIGEGEIFASVDTDGRMRVFEGKEQGFVEKQIIGEGREFNKTEDIVIVGGCRIRPTNGEWR